MGEIGTAQSSRTDAQIRYIIKCPQKVHISADAD